MNIPAAIWNEAKKRGLDWVSTGGGYDYIIRRAGSVELTLSGLEVSLSPERLDEPCNVCVAFHASGYVSLSIRFSNVIDALDCMAKAQDVHFSQAIHDEGRESGLKLEWAETP